MRGWRAGLLVACLVLVLPSCRSSSTNVPTCAEPGRSIFVLMAQAVPSATRLPCVAELPLGWTFAGSQIQNGMARLWLDSDRAGSQAVEVDLVTSCHANGADVVAADADEAGTHVFRQRTSASTAIRAERLVVFEGGCVLYRFDFDPDVSTTLALEAGRALSFVPRSTINAFVCHDLGLELGGAGAQSCSG